MPGKNESLPDPGAPARPADPIDLTESVAGEEDPGASVDLARPAARPAQPAAKPGEAAPDKPAAGKA